MTIHHLKVTKRGEEFIQEAANSMERLARRYDSVEADWVFYTVTDWPNRWKYHIVLLARDQGPDFELDTDTRDWTLDIYQESFNVSDFFDPEYDRETPTEDEIPGFTDDDVETLIREGLIERVS
jgi:hypothetical protein